ncbi:hypothetical protein [Desulfosarcina ovata]|uniref:Uncharacterized protein n=1 Tax=Desulfosarcina ovata subsp. ovata TaxID=2752305 RepID=A0A5K8A8I8_9BACT|nr:hypothetical protein [Desulfosarcina ovata]BBO88953.1 hypothetical protein DSCOOX_21330 [Desulfosarcina ovata subsp. ovata]
MPDPNNPNLLMLEMAAEKLGPLVDVVVFLGGCATGLLITDPAAPPLRVTRDVDVIVEVASLSSYHRFSSKLRKRGFVEDSSPGAPICRWLSRSLVLDVMPTDPDLLGFGNQWFERAFKTAQRTALPSGMIIKVLPAPYFIATKIEAFANRGAGDFLLSKDVEDVVAVIDGRLELAMEVNSAEPDLMHHIAKNLTKWMEHTDFIDALPGLMPPDSASQARVSTIVNRIEKIAKREK